MSLEIALDDIEKEKKTQTGILNLSGLDLNEIPQEIRELHHLSKLFLNNNQISEINVIDNLSQITELNLEGNQITEIKGLDNLSRLTGLYLSDNKISEIKGLDNLRKLAKLNLNENKIIEIKGLDNLIWLCELNLNGNKISEIKGMDNLIRLDKLDLSSNQISQINGLDNLSQLTELDLNDNQISKIKGLERLRQLSIINLIRNKIDDLSPLQFLKSVKAYYVVENPITSPPQHIWSQGSEALRNYYQQLEDQGTVKLQEAKLILVGEPGAGKTSLMRKLIDPEHEVREHQGGESTLGVNIEEGWEFPISNDPNRSFAANLWDFGGQVIQYMTHQFFLTPDALYVLVADDRKQHTNFPYWFEIIHLLGQEEGRPSPILVVLNENQHRSITNYDHARWQERYPESEIQKYEVDLSQTDVRFERLRKGIQEQLQQLHIVGDELPAKWKVIREELRALAKTKDHLTNAEFRNVCGRLGLKEEEDQNVLSGYLHKLGSVLHYTQDPSLEDLVILNPQWAVDAVYTVLSNKEVEKRQGRFTKQQVYKIWEEYKPSEKPKLLNLMRQAVFEICYEVKKDHYIAPQLLPTIKPTFAFDETEALRFRFQYAFMPKGIITRLIVRLHDWIVEETEGQPWIWRSGAVFEDKGAHALIEEEERNEEGQSVIDLTVSGDLHERKYLLNKIIGEVHRIHKKWFARIKIKEMIPCHCGECQEATTPHFFDFRVMRAYREKGHEVIMCDKSIEPQSISELLEGVAIPRQKDIRVLHSSHKWKGPGYPRADTYTLGSRERALFNPGEARASLFISYSKTDQTFADTLKLRLKPLARRKSLDIFYDQDLMAGENFDAALQGKLLSADVILLLISPDSLGTDYIMEVEVPLAQQQNEADKAKVIPIILRDGDDWKDEPFLQDLNAIPNKGTPISSYPDPDVAWKEVVNAIKEVVGG
ncbi:MAG: leucine-rich repeat protein [Bacteroidota bacterium]